MLMLMLMFERDEGGETLDRVKRLVGWGKGWDIDAKLQRVNFIAHR